MSHILRKHRTAALVGAAILAGAACLPFAINSTTALAAPSDSGGILAAGGSFATIVEADKPAVVTITTTMKASDVSADQQSPMDEQFRQFFEDQGIPLPRQAPRDRPSQHAMALGSGFIISPDGVIVTNNHVIDNALDIKVTLDDGTELPAKLIGADPKSDVAVLKITAGKPLQTIAWGDSDRLKLGDQILAIGNPFGIGTTVTAGIVSARGRDLHSGPYDDFIQIDAPINHGNSGGPLVDREGKVVGINTAIYSPNGGSVGVGFAIPSVAAVSADTPAAQAGLKPGDIVTSVGGEAVKTPKDLSRLVADLSPGTRESLGVWRDGKTIDLNVTVGTHEDGQKQAAAENPETQGQASGQPSLGIGLADLTPDVRRQLDLPRSVSGAVVASVNPDKSAAAAGIQSGDVIVSVNDRPVHNARDVKAAIAEAGKAGRKSVLLLVERDGSKTFVAVPFAAA
ncbi:UNVERIFIED_ORG: serine protease Do [Rhizobium etli]